MFPEVVWSTSAVAAIAATSVVFKETTKLRKITVCCSRSAAGLCSLPRGGAFIAVPHGEDNVGLVADTASETYVSSPTRM